MKWILLGALVAVGGIVAWMVLSKDKLPPGFASGNGRLEATDIYVATKYPGRVKEVLVSEGDTVEAGQVVARMDVEELDAKIRAAQAKVIEAQARIAVAQADREFAVAQVGVKDADYAYADKTYSRSQNLVKGGAVSEQEADIDLSRRAMAQAELVGARAQVAQAQASIDAAKADVVAGQAEIESLEAEKKDSILVAPIRSRVETRLAEPGEVLAAGGRVYTLLDLSDVYMYIFLPAAAAGKVSLGSESRIVLDAAPDFPIRTTVSYVSPEAQFTPKTVETAEERYALSFRVKLQLDKERLKEFEPFVKSGVPGVGYVRFDQNAQWPASLQPNAASPGQLWAPTGSTADK